MQAGRFAGLLHRHPLAVIVIAQLFATSLWFSVNGVGLSLQQELGWTATEIGWLTMATQLGFITGTLVAAATGLADRVRASRLFMVSALLGALVNAGFILLAGVWEMALVVRFVVGLCLAGVYPLGMKLVISWTPQHKGWALSWLLGMLTLGTALPHLLRGVTLDLVWPVPMMLASVLAVAAAWMIARLGDGPHLPPPGRTPGLGKGFRALGGRDFRAVAGGYFGHCWELYAFWTLVPLLVAHELTRLDAPAGLVPWLAFAVIGLGAVGCVWGGRLSRRLGSLRVARVALATSGLVCLLYPLLAGLAPWLLLGLLALWGLTVIADSPQFSALAAESAPQDAVGSALSVMNAIGFALTLPSILVTAWLWDDLGLWVVWLLLPGPALGLWALSRLSGPRGAGRG
ncbi:MULTISPECIES: MFS transporter [unclassified Thioalkalivibrio]|uniref:MFS transporter n=1 Tax=unclassified Thioalkalivibrio TaxID=2621013 RepID=UPI000381E845|nr:MULTISPECIES: MFS transporter [unclassified Thioalkalivibrio]